ncbi:zinc finger protein basonuclin-2-like isoform X2 [Watersipora subatra]|uniref:zinc finger protein basonuclin-2-like isoform X2 n=1 Tax=Watersipora subatra TaxID=2589382 RepID=UPI00355C33A5
MSQTQHHRRMNLMNGVMRNLWRAPPQQRFVAIRCTFPKCTCECFSSTKNQIRTCQSCNHGWVAHAIGKLISSNLFSGVGSPMESISPSIVFDIASLILYGCQAIPIRLKMSLDRLFSALQHDEVLQILHGFGWSYEDYARGYILQDPSGRVLEKYSIISREEEITVLQQFTRFVETRNISQELLLHDSKSMHQDVSSQSSANQSKSDSDIRKFIERNNMTFIQSYNLALKRAFDSPQSILSAMGAGFPPHLNLAAAAAASQFGRNFPAVGGLMSMPTGSFAHALDSKPDPTNPSEPLSRTSAEPYDLTKRSPTESHSKSCSPASSVSIALPSNSNLAPSFPKLERRDREESNVNGALMNDIGKRNASPPSTPLKRPASPPSSKQAWPFNNPAFGQTVFVTPSGKKRVLCTACNKTFCDKGALKIHYSAVHLKEMHRCTIRGCNMMFSSRRSRNRHSANPNPKLHTPQTRRPRERYESEQDRMAAMMGLATGTKLEPKLENDGGSSVDDNEMCDAMQDKIGMDEFINRDSNTVSEDEQCDIEYSGEFSGEREELPTQVKMKPDGPLYRCNKRKRLMPTRVQMSTTPTGIEEDLRPDEDKDTANSSMEDMVNVGNSERVLPNGRDQINCEIGEVRLRSPAEPGEVIRQESLSDKNKLMPKFSMANLNKQSSMMQSLFSFLPPSVDNQGSAFWSNIIQQTAAAAQKANQHLNIEDNSEDESNCSEIDERKFECKIEGCNSLFDSEESRDVHSMNISLHCKMFENNQTVDESNGNQSKECLFCDKSFTGNEALSKHLQAVHQGQQALYSDANFSTQLDSLKAKTPVIA